MGNGPVKIIKIGGVKVDANSITSTKTVNENGATRFVISFKDGSTVKYPAQAAKNNSAIELEDTRFGECMEDYRMSINRIFGLEYTGTKGVDHVTLNGCRSCTVDVVNGNSGYEGDFVKIQDFQRTLRSPILKSGNNEVKMDKQDIVCDNEKWVINGEGIHHEGDSSDKLK